MDKFESLSKCDVNGEAAPPVAAGRKRKASCGEEFVPRRRNFAESAEASSNSDEPKASCFSSKLSVEVDNGASKSADLKVKEETDELETSTYKLVACGKRGETTPLTDEAPVEQAEMKSTPTPPSPLEDPPRELTGDEGASKSPTKAELEEFFAQAEALVHQELTEKYNFDFKNEKPLAGRFEWVRVEP